MFQLSIVPYFGCKVKYIFPNGCYPKNQTIYLLDGIL